MPGPVNQFKLVKKTKADFRGTHDLFIDQKSIADQINEYELLHTKTPWPEHSRCLINLEALKASSTDGEFAILICANCASMNYTTCEDIGLAPIKVIHKDSLISWEISAAKWTGKNREPLIFHFDSKQYLKNLGEL